MKIPQPIVITAASGMTAAANLFWQQSVMIMMPWVFAILAAVIADLASGWYKSKRLGVHFAWSTAIRETLGKMVVYVAAVMTFAMFDVAAEGDATIAKWLSIFVASVEIGSVISNILAPHGIRLSLKAILKIILKKSPLGIGDEEADEIIKIAKRENSKWNTPKFSSDRSIGNRPANKILDEETGKITYVYDE
jgi:hypothetical protein